jgi:hypothetical protein
MGEHVFVKCRESPARTVNRPLVIIIRVGSDEGRAEESCISVQKQLRKMGHSPSNSLILSLLKFLAPSPDSAALASSLFVS